MTETEQSLAQKLSTFDILQDANGSDVYSAMKVQLGYIDAHFTLQLPKSFVDAVKPESDDYLKIEDIEKKTLADYQDRKQIEEYLEEYPYQMGVVSEEVEPPADGRSDGKVYYGDKETAQLNLFKVVALNYLAIKKRAESQKAAATIAKLRGRFVELGLANVMLSDNETDSGKKEYIIVDKNHPDKDFAAISEATTIADFVEALGEKANEVITTVITNDDLNKWVVRYADHIIAASEYVFRTRGHHFKTNSSENESYQKLYERYFEASFPGEVFNRTDANFFDIFHSAIHPFKVKALVVLTHHFGMHKTLSSAALLRFGGAPTGNAMITTTVAALGNLAGESWYPKFESIYGKQIDTLKVAKNAICSQRYSFHQAASLYGVTKKETVKIDNEEMHLETIKTECSSIAAACQGYINVLSELVKEQMITGFALSNAKALQKAADQSPMMALKISSLVSTSIDIITSSRDVKKAADQFLIDAKEQTSQKSDNS